MAPSHTDGGSQVKHKPKKVKTSTVSTAKQHGRAPFGRRSKNKNKYKHKRRIKRDDTTQAQGKHRADPASKVSKENKVRQRAGRGRGRRKGEKQKDASTVPNQQDEAEIQSNHERHDLLTLPEEIRINIFTQALEEPETIEVTRNLKLPGLLFVCRQLREETLPIWHRVSSFEMHIHRFDSSLFIRWSDLIASASTNVNIKAAVTDLEFDDIFSWSNLLTWCWAMHSSKTMKCLPIDEEDDEFDGYKIASCATSIAYGMRGQPWWLCAFLLDNLRRTLRSLGVEWV